MEKTRPAVDELPCIWFGAVDGLPGTTRAVHCLAQSVTKMYISDGTQKRELSAGGAHPEHSYQKIVEPTLTRPNSAA